MALETEIGSGEETETRQTEAQRIAAIVGAHEAGLSGMNDPEWIENLKRQWEQITGRTW